MTVVIDTNVVPGMFTPGHALESILEAWITGRFDWAATTEILLEYEEVVARMSSVAKVRVVFQAIEVAETLGAKLLRITPHFRFRLITADPDDDKFADCAIAANADFILTDDRHFAVLRSSGYKPQPITPEEFLRKVLSVAA